MGIFSLLLAQTSRTSKARRLNAASSGRGSALTGCAAAGAIPGMLGGDASTAGANRDAGPAEQRAASDRGGRQGRRCQVGFSRNGGVSAMEISSLVRVVTIYRLDEF